VLAETDSTLLGLGAGPTLVANRGGLVIFDELHISLVQLIREQRRGLAVAFLRPGC